MNNTKEDLEKYGFTKEEVVRLKLMDAVEYELSNILQRDRQDIY